MSNLLHPTHTLQDYTAKDIEVLEGLEPVRLRPGMYIGGTDEKSMHHLVSEVLDNAMDEAVAGFANRIEIRLETDNTVSIKDNGRGIPTDPHPKFPDLSALEVIFTTLHSGGKFNDAVYQTSGGLHGVGISVVNALSILVQVDVARARQLWSQSFSQGHTSTPLIRAESPTNWRGTRIRFKPDPEIFGHHQFQARRIYELARSKAYLFKGVEIQWSCDPSVLQAQKLVDVIPATETLCYPNGLADYLAHKMHSKTSVIPNIFSGESDFPARAGRVEWAIGWLDMNEDTPEPLSFCNTIPTSQGGTHEAGVRQALTRSIKDFSDRIGQRKAQNITTEDVCSAAFVMLSCFIPQPQFQGQTKDRLVSPEATKLVENAIKDRFDLWLGEHVQEATQLIEHIIYRSEERLKRRQQREVARARATKRLRLPGKLIDCSSPKPEDSEIFLVEGDSAGGSAKQARLRQTQAVLPLRGKILNVANATAEKLRNNKELADLTLALGCGTGKQCNIQDLRYHKVIIMTDADVDGAHIASLLLTFFFYEMRPVLQHGFVYLAQPPLYKLSAQGQSLYVQSDAEKDRALKTHFKGKKRVEVSRFKGLGEMMATQLRDTTMDPKKRALQRILLPNEEALEIFVNQLMGKNPEARYNFIYENANLIENIDLG